MNVYSFQFFQYYIILLHSRHCHCCSCWWSCDCLTLVYCLFCFWWRSWSWRKNCSKVVKLSLAALTSFFLKYLPWMLLRAADCYSYLFLEQSSRYGHLGCPNKSNNQQPQLRVSKIAITMRCLVLGISLLWHSQSCQLNTSAAYGPRIVGIDITRASACPAWTTSHGCPKWNLPRRPYNILQLCRKCVSLGRGQIPLPLIKLKLKRINKR